MIKKITLLLAIQSIVTIAPAQSTAIDPKLRKGIVVEQFIYEEAPFPQCHASTIAETPEGLISAWFGGTREGNKDVSIYVSRMINDKWDKPFLVAEGIIDDKTRYACYNPVLYQVPGGELLLFYKVGPRVIDWTGWVIRSQDHGKTWSKPEQLPDGILGPIKNKPYLIGNTLVCPSSTERDGWKIHFEYTNDHGKTWSKGPDLNDAKPITGIQPSILRHGPQTLQALCRSTNGTINETWSYDNGKTWNTLSKTNLPNPNSGIDAITLKNGKHLLVYNEVKPDDKEKFGWGDRSPLNVAISSDGKNWEPLLILENEKGGEFSYPYVIQDGKGRVHITYTWKRKKIKHIIVAVP
ncbi:MAG: exo-alpha-sialidase [Chitinophagaceae bacterium]|jgi:predicted neuraminidase